MTYQFGKLYNKSGPAFSILNSDISFFWESNMNVALGLHLRHPLGLFQECPFRIKAGPPKNRELKARDFYPIIPPSVYTFLHMVKSDEPFEGTSLREA